MNAWKSTRRTVQRLLTLLGALGLTVASLPARALAASPDVVISQIYGGGGNAGATYTNDFIELHNRGASTVSLAGWSVQYASAAGSSWSTTALSGSIPAGGYFLVQQAAGTGGTTSLPTPDVTGTIAMSATAGKVALVSSTTALTGACPTGGSIVDFIGYGSTANCSESFPSSTLSNTLAAIRDRAGCADTDNNAADFASGAPAPRNSASPLRSCQYTLGVLASPLAGGSIGRSPDQPAYLDGSSVMLTATPTTGWHFVGWSGDASGVTNPLSIAMDADKNVTASFALNEYTLTYTAGPNGSISGTSPQTVAHGGDGTTVTAVPDVGYHFVSWSDGVLTAARTEIGVTADVTVSASFALNEYTLTYSAGPNGSISGTSPQTVAHGGDGTTVTAVPDVGYHFVSWSDGVLTAARTDLNVMADLSVSASFAINQYTLTATTVGNGAVVKLPDQPTYDYGGSVQLTATAAVGWHFVGWSGDASGSTNPLDVTMDADKAITATFEKNQVVVSQVYGGGGNSGATYTHDFIELFNRGTSPVDVSGWTVQYGSSGGTTWSSTPLTGTILPGRYLLVQEAQGSGGSTSLPTPDVTGTIPMSATAGKVALVNNAIALSGACPVSTSIEDLIGYGTANCSETAPIGALSNLNAAHRKSAGCIDTDDNSADLQIAPPTPRNSASPFNNCEFTLAVTVDPAASGAVAVSPDLPSYANGALVTLTATPIFGFHFVKWTGDASGNANPLVVTMNSSKSIVAHFASNSLIDGIVISQIYGGGGNTGSTYKQDYVELYNRGNFAVNITGWSLQYASDNGSTWFSTNLIGTIQPGQNYLIKQAQGVGGTLDIPPADAIGTVALSATGGKLALCTDGVVLSGSCPTGPTIIDYVGYGSSDCFEVAAAPALDNMTAGFRNSDGCDDTNHNSADFSAGAPAPRNSATPIHFCPEWVDVGPTAVTEFALSPVAPNPSHGAMRVAFALPVEARVRLQIMDLQGRLVSSLVDGSLPAGRHSLMWDGSTPGGPARSGMYFVRFEANGKRFVRSVMLTR